MPPDTGKTSNNTDPIEEPIEPPTNGQIILTSDEEDDEEEDAIGNGYELLADTTGNLDDSEGEDSLRVQNILQRQAANTRINEDPISEPLHATVRKESIVLSQDTSEKIKTVMAGIKLPASAIPLWAQVVPEENWKTLLDCKIKDKWQPSSEPKPEDNAK